MNFSCHRYVTNGAVRRIPSFTNLHLNRPRLIYCSKTSGESGNSAPRNALSFQSLVQRCPNPLGRQVTGASIGGGGCRPTSPGPRCLTGAGMTYSTDALIDTG